MDKSEVKKFSLILGGEGAFLPQKTKVAQNCLKWINLKSKIFPSSWGGGFSATKTKVAWNCLKWINLKSKNFPSSWEGRLFCHKNQSCLKLPEMDQSEAKKFSLNLGGGGGFSATKTKVAQNCLKWINLKSKKFSLILGGRLFCHKNQSCSKLPEMDKSEAKKFSLNLGGGAFLQQKPKLLEIAWNWWIWSQKIFPRPGESGFCHKNQSCSKLPEMDKSEVKKFSLILGGGGFSATETKVTRNCLKWINLKSKNFPHPGGGRLFCHKNQSCSKLPEMDKSEVKIFSLIQEGGGLFCHKNQSCSKWPEMDKSEVKKISLILEGRLFCHKNQSCSEIAWNG